MAAWVCLVIVTCFIGIAQSQFDPDAIIFPDDDNELGSSCIRDSDGKLGICSKLQDCRGIHKFGIAISIDFCNRKDQTVCCSLEHLYNSVDSRFGEEENEHKEDDKMKDDKVEKKDKDDKEDTEEEKSRAREIHATQALIGELLGDKRRIRWRCGGSLISPRLVLTSAHCIFSVDIPTYIRITTKDVERQIIEHTDASIDKIFIHPEYHPLKLYYDIAIVRLNKAIRGFQPVSLPTTNDTLLRDDLHVTGWLNTPRDSEEHKFVDDTVKLLPSDNCTSFFDLAELADGIVDNQFCGVIADNSSLVPCSGAFLGLLEAESHVVVAIPSFTIGCSNDRPYVFTNIAHFIPWIKALIDDDL
ncbi:serine protease Hayan-like [Phlebotomus argentipes]|uniref:serine protease Hayan-like n=1 Tax=Phlebotomus argentipes TaxID=94469 RepID=UPI00289326C6|nr:serine protease Hayan-like [Phlebotomus argentipes]